MAAFFPGGPTRPAHIMIPNEEVRQGIIVWRALLGVKAEMTHIDLQLIEHFINQVASRSHAVPPQSIENPTS